MKIQLTFYHPGVINIWPVCFNESFKCLKFPSRKSSWSKALQWFSLNSFGGFNERVKNVCNCFLFFLVCFHAKVWGGALWPAHSLLCQLWLSDLLIKVPANEHVSLITAINTVFTNTACSAKYFADWKGGSVCVCVCAYSHVCVSAHSPWLSSGKSSRVLPSPFPTSAAGIAWFVTWSEEKENL